MELTTNQKATLKADAQSQGDTNALLVAGNLEGLVNLYNAPASPDYWVWRSAVTREEIYNGNPQPENSAWSWTTYKAQTVPEQNAWTQMFMGDQANFSKPNVRAGVAAIFTGSAPQTAQRDHILACGRRKASRIEKLFATGTGSTAVPATMAVEGILNYELLIGL